MSSDDLAWRTVTPRRCRHPRDRRIPVEGFVGTGEVSAGWTCLNCGHTPDPAKIRTGKLAAKRGKRIQRERIVALGGRNLAGNNPNLDGVGELFAYESKSGPAYFSRRYARLLKGIPHSSQQVPVLIVTETPGSGVRAQAYVVVGYDDWRDLHGETTEDAA